MNSDDVIRSYSELMASMPNHVCVVAVSKTKPASMIQALYSAGQRDFGENKVQEMATKAASLPGDIHWHFIGHLQRNKVKYIAPFVHLIHSVDSERLLSEIDKRAEQSNRTIDCLIQVFIALEETKFGLDESELRTLLEKVSSGAFKHIRIRGLMGMATNTGDQEQVRSEFGKLNQLYKDIQGDFSGDQFKWDLLSMGMTGDYQLALEEGSNTVRIGSLIFGERS